MEELDQFTHNLVNTRIERSGNNVMCQLKWICISYNRQFGQLNYQ